MAVAVGTPGTADTEPPLGNVAFDTPTAAVGDAADPTTGLHCGIKLGATVGDKGRVAVVGDKHRPAAVGERGGASCTTARFVWDGELNVRCGLGERPRRVSMVVGLMKQGKLRKAELDGELTSAASRLSRTSINLVLTSASDSNVAAIKRACA